MDQNPRDHEVDNFKIDFKYYKQKAKIPSLENVLDFENESSVTHKAEKVCLEFPDSPNRKEDMVQPSSLWEVYRIFEVPGLYYIKKALSLQNQIHWAMKCVEQYSVSPYVTNLDAFQSKESVDGAWVNSKVEFSKQDKKNGDSLLKKLPIWNLRWSTLGYHHDWDSKHYHKDFKSGFPSDLEELCVRVAEVLGFEKYCPEAAIVNFYHTGSTLAPHRDVSEADLTLPLISISLGLDAIFLIGGRTKDIRPVPLLIRSGDIAVMSGDSRTSYHALARVMPSSRLNCDGIGDDFLSLYLQNSRININVRQVESEECTLP